MIAASMIQEALTGFMIGFAVYLLFRYVVLALYIVEQNERAVITSFGKAERASTATTLDLPIAEFLDADAKKRYSYPQLKIKGPGGPYIKLPWEKVFKVNIAIQTVNIAYDPETPEANQNGSVLDAVTKDQLNIGITGQMRYRVCENNIYAYLFGVKNPIAHVMGYFISILRERIANFTAPAPAAADKKTVIPETGALTIEGISINDLRKNLNDLNVQMDDECRSSSARYGIILDASLITSFDSSEDVEGALAAINTTHNEVSAEISRAQASADQKIEQSKRAVEIEVMRAQAETQPLIKLAEQLVDLKASGPDNLKAFIRNVKLELYTKAEKIFLTGRKA